VEAAMPVNFMYSFPLKHEQAVETLESAPWSPAERGWLENNQLSVVYHPLSGEMIRHWHLDDKTYPLPRHYMRRFSLGDAGDMACLIVLNLLANIRQEEFNMEGYVNEFRRVWFARGIDPLTLEKIKRP
jgi:hypothetical protein